LPFNTNDSRVLIIGSGIVGLSIGLRILDVLPRVNVTIVDKEREVGLHASSRNSGVIHSGIYYRTDSQKAKFCVEGNPLLKKKLDSLGVPVLHTGKILVAKDEYEVSVLQGLAERAVANKVQADMHPAHEINQFQPGARTHESFLFIRDTAISDPKLLIDGLSAEFISKGGSFVLDTKAELSLKGSTVSVAGLEADLVINAAGAGAVDLARPLGLAQNLKLIPFLGLYFGSKSLGEAVKVPIYPVPNPVNPFLGVHLTPTIKGLTKIGPTAIPVLGREQYSWTAGTSLRDVAGSTRALLSMAIRQPKAFWDLATKELPRLLKSNVLKEATALYPGVRDIRDWQNLPAGIRAQLIDVTTGKLVDDFIVEEHENSIHILNAVSPGWTSALSFAEWLVDTHVRGKIQ